MIHLKESFRRFMFLYFSILSSILFSVSPVHCVSNEIPGINAVTLKEGWMFSVDDTYKRNIHLDFLFWVSAGISTVELLKNKAPPEVVMRPRHEAEFILFLIIQWSVINYSTYTQLSHHKTSNNTLLLLLTFRIVCKYEVRDWINE